MRHRPVLLLLASVAVACGGAVADFRSASGLDFRECGDTTVGHACPPLDTFDCVRDARALCVAAHMTVRTPTVEGALVVTDYFVVPKDGGCTVVVFTDDTADSFSSSPGVTRQDCSDFEEKRSCDVLTPVCPAG